jgi:hypothetical protein
MKKYYSPTPAKWRKIGDSLLLASTTITTFAIYEKAEWLAYAALFTGVIGKFLSNLFSEEQSKS